MSSHDDYHSRYLYVSAGIRLSHSTHYDYIRITVARLFTRIIFYSINGNTRRIRRYASLLSWKKKTHTHDATSTRQPRLCILHKLMNHFLIFFRNFNSTNKLYFTRLSCPQWLTKSSFYSLMISERLASSYVGTLNKSRSFVDLSKIFFHSFLI